MPTGTWKHCKNHWKSLCFCVPGPEGGGQNKETSYDQLETFKNLVKTVGFRNLPFLGKLNIKTVLRRGALDLHWEHKKTIGFLGAPGGWDP